VGRTGIFFPCGQSSRDFSWTSVLARAATVEEFLGSVRASQAASAHSNQPPAPLPDWLIRWTQAVCPKLPGTLTIRLGWDGVDMTALSRLANPEDAPLSGRDADPAWLRYLMEVRQLSQTLHRFSPDFKSVPFAAILQPFVAVGRNALRRQTNNELFDRLPTECRLALEGELLNQLSDLAASALFAEFELFRDQQPTHEPALADGGSDSRYQEFVRFVQFEGSSVFLCKYAALARQLGGCIEFWVGATRDFLARLDADRAAISRRFNGGRDPGGIRALRPALSDRHHGGRQAMGVTFADGLKLLYKPKSLHQEAAFAGLLDFLRETGALSADVLPTTVPVLVRPGYGWAGFVDGSAVASTGEAARYYQQAGVLLGLVHLLGGNDAVMDNLIATRTGPVLIDLETFFQPRAASAPGAGVGGSLLQAKATVADSVLRTGLLPMWQRSAQGVLYDISGLAGEGQPDTGRSRPEWREINTDAMHVVKVPDPRPAQQNLLSLDGQSVPAADYLEELEDGYRTAARAVMSARGRLLGPEGKLHELFGACVTRFLLRPSYVYSLLHGELAQAAAWRSGVERGISMERLLRPFVQRAEPMQPPPPFWPLLQRERASLEQGDIPHFPIAVDAGPDLRLTNAHDPGAAPLVIPGLFSESGLALAAARLEALDGSAIETQVRLIRAAFHRPSDEQALARHATPESRAELDATDPLPGAVLLECAGELACQVMEHAVPSGEDCVTWFSPDGLRLDEQTIRGGNYYLYDGNCGIALFLAACTKLGLVEAREIIRRASRPVETMLFSGAAPTDSQMRGLGICVGMSSVVYACTRIADFLDDSSYLETARRVAAEITPQRVANDRAFDVFGGCAGAILALLALHRSTGVTEHLQTALLCGRHLMTHQRVTPAGGAAWRAVDGRVPTGFAHGAAGIAYALSRLDGAAGTTEFTAGIDAALRYERALFQSASLNWPMITESGGGCPTQPMFLNAWCNGAAGIGLARLGMGAAWEPTVGEDIRSAVRKNEIGGLPKVDFLCCGNFGRIGFLHEVARRTGDPGPGEEANRRAALAIRRGQEAGGFSFGVRAADDRCFHPGLFRGVAGIGYQLLRLACSGQIPALLLFE